MRTYERINPKLNKTAFAKVRAFFCEYKYTFISHLSIIVLDTLVNIEYNCTHTNKGNIMNITLTDMRSDDVEVLRGLLMASVVRELENIKFFESTPSGDEDEDPEETLIYIRERVDNLRSIDRMIVSVTGLPIPEYHMKMWGYDLSIFDKYETLRWV